MKKLIKFIFLLIIIFVTLILYSRYYGTNGLITKEVTLEYEIDNSFDGLKIVHFSDLHYPRLITEDKLKQIVEEINLIKPDIVVFTGDLLDMDYEIVDKKNKDDIYTINDEDINLLTKYLNMINATYGKYSITGNHDIMKEIEVFEKIYSESNFILLDNDYDIIYKNNAKLFVGGLSCVSYDKEDLNKMMSYFNENEDINFKIILVHEPDYTDSILENYPDVNLILAGHSHNGQINIPFIKNYFLPAYSRTYYEEYYKIDNTDLYISSGIGVSKFNYRFLNKPSINFYRIKKVTTNK